MPQPTSRGSHIDAVLTNISVAYVQKQEIYIADKVFPVVPVAKQSDRYYVYNKGDFFRDEAQKRGPSSESAGGGYRVSDDSYFCDVWAFHKDVDDQLRANADNPLRPDRDATTFVTQKLLIRRDKLFLDEYFKAGVWTTDIAGVASGPGAGQVLRWDVDGSTPIADIDLYKETIRGVSGFNPNVLVVGPKVHRALRNNADVIERIKYTQRGSNITPELLAGMFEVDRYVVAYGIENTAPETIAADGNDATMAFMAGNHALLVYAAPSPGLMEPTGGYIMAWTGLLGAGAYGGRIGNFRMEKIKSDRIEGEMAMDMKLVAPDLGVFFSDIVS